MTWHKHTPGDPMPVDGDTTTEVEFANGLKSKAYPASTWNWTETGDYAITAYRVIEPAKPAARWVSVQEEPHPVDGKLRWYRTEVGHQWLGCYKAQYGAAAYWHTEVIEPPAFKPPAPMTDAEKLAKVTRERDIAVWGLQDVHTCQDWSLAADILAKIGGGE